MRVSCPRGGTHPMIRCRLYWSEGPMAASDRNQLKRRTPFVIVVLREKRSGERALLYWYRLQYQHPCFMFEVLPSTDLAKNRRRWAGKSLPCTPGRRLLCAVLGFLGGSAVLVCVCGGIILRGERAKPFWLAHFVCSRSSGRFFFAHAIPLGTERRSFLSCVVCESLCCGSWIQFVG